MNENNRMPSIARRINMHFWLKQFSSILLIDIAIIVVIAVSFFMWRSSLVPDTETIASRYFLDWGNYDKWQYVIKAESGVTYGFLMNKLLTPLKTPAIILGLVEIGILFFELFGAKDVRRIMKPLNEIAIRTEELSNMNFDAGKFQTFEHAIEKVNPEMPGAKVKTGDKDLQSLEIAINNLIERMRESHRQQERFVSDASHELRTPIAVIQGYVNMLDRWGKEDETVLNESIEALKNESEQMKNLVEQLLFLARGDSGRNTLKREDFDLSATVKDVLEESQMIDENHVYRFSGDDNVIVNGDISMIKQSMRILVQNASKYSDAGDTITLGAKVIDTRPAYIVQDEGIGMQAEDLSHVFERFYRADSARTAAEGGTGLGLSIAKWIVDAHEGTIDILSRPDFGTRFTVQF